LECEVLPIYFFEQENVVCMWQFKDREGVEDARLIIQPEVVCSMPVRAGVTDLCFLDERTLIASLENGGVSLLQYSPSTKVLSHIWITFNYVCILCTYDDPLPKINVYLTATLF